MALLDVQVATLANQALYYLVSGNAPVRMGNGHAAVVPYQGFPVADGFVIIAVGNDGQFAKLVAELGHPDWARSEEHTSELQSLMRISYAVFCLKKKNNNTKQNETSTNQKMKDHEQESTSNT